MNNKFKFAHNNSQQDQSYHSIVNNKKPNSNFSRIRGPFLKVLHKWFHWYSFIYCDPRLKGC